MPSESKAIAELARQVALHGLKPFLGSTQMLVALLDARGGLLVANPAIRALERRAADSGEISDLVVPKYKKSAQRLLGRARGKRSGARARLDFGSELRPIHCECFLVPAGGGRFLLFAEPVVEVPGRGTDKRLQAELESAKAALASKHVELQAVLAQADEVAHTDALTFLPNRRSIVADLQREVIYSERYGTPLTISMLDLDNFKYVNDTYGHTAGDNVLRTISTDLRAHVRQPDEVGRYGGDEYLVLLPNSTVAAAIEQANRLCQQVRATSIPLGNEVVRLTLSVGIAQLRIREETWQTLLERADRALYEAKDQGGNQWKVSET